MRVIFLKSSEELKDPWNHVRTVYASFLLHSNIISESLCMHKVKRCMFARLSPILLQKVLQSAWTAHLNWVLVIDKRGSPNKKAAVGPLKWVLKDMSEGLDASQCSISYQIYYTGQIIRLLKALATFSLKWVSVTYLIWESASWMLKHDIWKVHLNRKKSKKSGKRKAKRENKKKEECTVWRIREWKFAQVTGDSVPRIK